MDADTYRRLVLEHKDRITSYAAWLAGDREEGIDVAQESLIRMWTHRARVRPEAARSWLMKTAYRLCIDRSRRRRVRGEVGEEALTPVAHEAPGPERMALSGELGGLIERALGRLSTTDRAAVVMREVHGMSYDEIAETLALPLGTVKAKLHRTRDKLRRDLVGAGVTP